MTRIGSWSHPEIEYRSSRLEGYIARVDFLFVVIVGRSWRCSECFAKSAALEGRMLSFWVQEAFWVDLLMSRVSCRLLWLRRRCCLVATSFSQVVPVDIRYPVIGYRTVSFDFLMIFLFVDDDCSCVVANVDNIVQVILGVVERVAELLWLMLCLENHLRVVV